MRSEGRRLSQQQRVVKQQRRKTKASNSIWDLVNLICNSTTTAPLLYWYWYRKTIFATFTPYHSVLQSTIYILLFIFVLLLAGIRSLLLQHTFFLLDTIDIIIDSDSSSYYYLFLRFSFYNSISLSKVYKLVSYFTLSIYKYSSLSLYLWQFNTAISCNRLQISTYTYFYIFLQLFFLHKFDFHRFDNECRARNWIPSSECDDNQLISFKLPVIKMILSTFMSKIHKIISIRIFFFTSLLLIFFVYLSSWWSWNISWILCHFSTHHMYMGSMQKVR